MMKKNDLKVVEEKAKRSQQNEKAKVIKMCKEGLISEKMMYLVFDVKGIEYVKWNLGYDKIPSETTDTYWIRIIANPDIHEKLKTKPDSGKWLIFSDLSKIDALWDKIKKATSMGLLGSQSKCATAAGGAGRFSKKVICVYTNSVSDTVEVMRVRDELRKLGITWKIPYKLDSLVGTYKIDGNKNISSLYV